MSRTCWYGSSNGMPFQPSTITLDEVPMPKANRPGAASARVATRLGQAGRAAGEGGHDRGAEPQRRRPDRRQGQRGEARRPRWPRPTTRRCSRGPPARRSSPAARAAGRRRRGWSCRSGGPVGAGTGGHGRSLGTPPRPATPSAGRSPCGVAQHAPTGWPWPAGCRPGPQVAPSRGRSRCARRRPGCRTAPTRSARSRTTRSVLSRLFDGYHPPRPGRCRTARSRRGWPARRPDIVARRASGPTARSGRRAPGCRRSSSQPEPMARRTSRRVMIDRSWPNRGARVGQSSGAGTSGMAFHWPLDLQVPGSERGVHREDLPVAHVAHRPGLGGVAARDGDGDVDVHDRARAWRSDRYCAVAHTTGRSHTASMAATAAPSPHPPNRNWPAGRDAAVTGRNQRIGLWVGCRPRNSAASIAGRLPAARAARPILPQRRATSRVCQTADHDRHTVAGRRLLAGRRLPRRGALARPRSSRRPWPPSSPATLNAFSFVDPERAPGQGRGRRRGPAVRRRALRRQGAAPGRGLARHRGAPWSSRTGSPTTPTTKLVRAPSATAASSRSA